MSDTENQEETVLDAVQNIASEQTEQQEEAQDTEVLEQEEPVEEDPKKKWVEFTPEQQAKFNDMYKQTKMSDARNQMLTKMLEEQQKQLDELKSRFSQTDQAEAEKILKQRLQEARDEGDVDKELKIFDELIAVRNAEKPKAKEPQKQELADDPETRYVVALAQETDDSGQPLRPWLSDKHPRYKSMLTQAAIVAAELEASGKEADITSVMKLLDERMNKKPNPRSPDPLGGNLTTSKNTNNIKPKLSSQEKAIAAKLGMSEADYLEGKLTYGVKR